MVKIIEGGVKRASLDEGRNYGLGSAFCKKTGEEEYTLLFGITACKDYLHDVLAAEELDEYVNVYGLKYQKTQPFTGDTAYIAISILNNGYWDRYKEEQQTLKKNKLKLARFIRHFEKLLNIEGRTKILDTDAPNVFLLSLPIAWTKTTYLISLYTLLIRIGYKFETKQKVENYVKDLLDPNKIYKQEYGDDVGTLRAIYPKIEWMAKNGLPKEDFQKRRTQLGVGSGWHNNGILAVSIGDKKSQWLE